MKSILMSIKPKWVHKIISEEKTVEVRKHIPKCALPFKVYIYCTKSDREWKDPWTTAYESPLGCLFNMSGKVVGEFVCDEIFDISFDNVYGYIGAFDYVDTGLQSPELHEYAKGKTVYGLHISDLKIYDKPKELSEFQKPLRCGNFKCTECGYFEYYAGVRRRCNLDWSLKRPPQSWCYVEEV